MRNAALFAAAWLVVACGPSGTPEDEIRALIAQGKNAAEERDAPTLRDLVADDYRDAEGRGAEEIRRYLHGYLIAHQAIHLVTRIDNIELQGPELAQVQVTVGMLGREANAESAWDLAGDIHHFDLRLARDGAGHWRVTRASWDRES